MNKARQRSAAAVMAAALVGGASIACQARSTPEAIQTAVGAAQAVATQVGTGIPDAQTLVPRLQVLLAGTALQIKTTPTDAPRDQVTEINIDAIDAAGTIVQLDTRARQAAASAALIAAAQYYPNATIWITIVDSDGNSLLKANASPGQTPAFQ